LDEFERLLLKTIDETLRYTFGDVTTQAIYDYLEKKSCPISEIPRKLNTFSIELRMILGTGRRQILGSAAILEKTILKKLCLKLGIEFNEKGPVVFSDYIKKLREVYNHGKVRKF